MVRSGSLPEKEVHICERTRGANVTLLPFRANHWSKQRSEATGTFPNIMRNETKRKTGSKRQKGLHAHACGILAREADVSPRAGAASLRLAIPNPIFGSLTGHISGRVARANKESTRFLPGARMTASQTTQTHKHERANK